MSNTEVIFKMVLNRLEKLYNEEWDQIDNAGRYGTIGEIVALANGVADQSLDYHLNWERRTATVELTQAQLDVIHSVVMGGTLYNHWPGAMRESISEVVLPPLEELSYDRGMGDDDDYEPDDDDDNEEAL
jgi:hypothetical protein